MIESIVSRLWIILQVLVGYHLVFPLILYIFHFFRPGKNRRPKNAETARADYAVIVTAYEQTDSLPFVIDSLLKLKYPNYLIYVVADKCDISNLAFEDERVIILRPESTLASNTRSHFYAIRHFKRDHNRLTIIDSDNLVHPEYLDQLNYFFDKGYEAVQGVREAKNLNTNYACLDAARDIYYHFYDGKLLYQAGASATLAGSGMAFTTALYRECLEHKDVSGAGFDKVLQFEILRRNKKIAFAQNAIVFDEKTSESGQLVNQRARWINTWFRYFGFGFKLISLGVKNLSWNQFLFGFVLLRPPLFIFLILSAFCAVANLFININHSLVWAAGFASFILSFILALLSSDTDKRIYQSLVNIPKFMFFQVISLINSRRANQRSIATKHNNQTAIKDIVEIEENGFKR